MVKKNVEPDTILKKSWGSLIILIILQEILYIGDHLSLIIDHILPSILWEKKRVFCRKLLAANPGYRIGSGRPTLFSRRLHGKISVAMWG